MLDATQKEKVRRFMNDPGLSGAVFNVLLEAFLEERPGQDVQRLAASRLSIDYLKAAWKTLARYKNEVSVEPKEIKQIGL